MNDNTPFFSIGIASYNYAQKILKGLEQIKKQKFNNFEIIISDDGSTDDSVFVIKKFMSENPQLNIRLIEKKCNEGLIANKNTLLESAKGDYIILCDADDWMSDDLLECAYKKIKVTNPDRLICDIAHIDEKGKIIQIEHIPEKQTKWGWLIHHASFYKNEIIKNHHIKIINEPDDVYFVLEFSKYCRRISIMNDKVYYYWLVHKDSEGRKERKEFDDIYFDKYFIEEKKYLLSIIREFDKKSSISEGRKKKAAEINKNELVLTYLKLYCFDIFFRLQKLDLKSKIYYFSKLRDFSKKNLPDMWECPYLKLKSIPRMRPYVMDAVRFECVIEKLHLTYPFLILYHILTKVLYFDQ